jgi:hypothetical protein
MVYPCPPSKSTFKYHTGENGFQYHTTTSKYTHGHSFNIEKYPALMMKQVYEWW